MSRGDAKYFGITTEKEVEIRQQLQSPIPKEKLDGLKRLIANISKGRDVSEHFAEVIKNVISDNVEVKKLTYMFLLHYAEQRQDEALLSVNSFQKDLSNKSQYIRAMALRVMTSIRVPVIAQILALGIKKCASDLSPYVRKAAAMAIPKVFNLDAGEKDTLMDLISQLLGDSSTVVVGTAVVAFNEVCPDNFALLHKNFRRLCRILTDCDEWSQVTAINVLLHYGRTQFLDPFKNDKAFKDVNAAFYSEDEDGETLESSKKPTSSGVVDYDLDNDHRLLLRSAQPLLQSRNSSVVMAVASLFFHLAPPVELGKVAKAMIRLLRSHREIQYVVLKNIATMAVDRPALFEPYIKEFYVGGTDPAYVAMFKVEILCRLASDANVMTILKEFQQYIKFIDKNFVRAVVQAIGRIAARVPDICETCMSGLLGLLGHKNEHIAAESVVVIRFLLQSYPEEHKKVVVRLAKKLDAIQDEHARASILWTVGEYCEKIPMLATECLRKLLRNFADEPDTVKRQVLNLGAKLHRCKSAGKKAAPFFEYALALAKYDANYDIRDTARVLRVLLLTANSDPELVFMNKYEKAVFETKKAAPIMTSWASDASRFAIGSLSLMCNHTLAGYQKLPDFPETQPDPNVRNVGDLTSSHLLTAEESGRGGRKGRKDKKFSDNLEDFYASSETSEEESESGSERDPFYGSDESGSGSGSSDEESDEDSDEESDEDSDEESDEESEDEDEESEDEESSEDERDKKKMAKSQQQQQQKSADNSRKGGSEIDLDKMLGIPAGSSGAAASAGSLLMEQNFASLQLK